MERYQVMVNGPISSSPDSAKPKVIGIIECAHLTGTAEPTGKSRSIPAETFTLKAVGNEQTSWRENRDACTVFKNRNIHHIYYSDAIAIGEGAGDLVAGGGPPSGVVSLRASSGSLPAGQSTIYLTFNSTRYNICGNETKIVLAGTFRAHYPTLDLHYGIGGVELHGDARFYVNISPSQEVLIDFYAQNFYYSPLYSQRALSYSFLFAGHNQPPGGSGPAALINGSASANSATTGILGGGAEIGPHGDNFLDHVIYYNYEGIRTAVALLNGMLTNQAPTAWDMAEINRSLPVDGKACIETMIVMSPKMEEQKVRILGNPNRATIHVVGKDTQLHVAGLAGPEYVCISTVVNISGAVAMKFGASNEFRVLPKKSTVRITSGKALLVIDKNFGILFFNEVSPAMVVETAGPGAGSKSIAPPVSLRESSFSVSGGCHSLPPLHVKKSVAKSKTNCKKTKIKCTKSQSISKRIKSISKVKASKSKSFSKKKNKGSGRKQ